MYRKRDPAQTSQLTHLTVVILILILVNLFSHFSKKSTALLSKNKAPGTWCVSSISVMLRNVKLSFNTVGHRGSATCSPDMTDLLTI